MYVTANIYIDFQTCWYTKTCWNTHTCTNKHKLFQ